MITATFSITLTGAFLSMQLNYVLAFSSDSVVSVNEKHYSNNEEVLNMLENVITPYIEEQGITLSLDLHNAAVLIMDVLKGQMACSVRELLNEKHILLKKVPANLTYLFQPLDVQGGSNGYVKCLYEEKV